MSEIAKSIIFQIASDPRDHSEFNAIRQEINKINHPAQPQVNWSLIESSAVTLFRTHGVDLQTAVYYTLARSHLEGLSGFTEGCELLAALVVYHWEQLWPEQPLARTEILEWFNARAGSQLRQYRFEERDLDLLHRAARALQLLCEKLQQVGLKRIPRVENLLYLMQTTTERLIRYQQERQKAAPEVPPPMPIHVYLPDVPVPSAHDIPFTQPGSHAPYNAKSNVKKTYPAFRGFVCGVLLSMLAGVAIYLLQIRPMQQQLTTLAATPEGAVQLWLAEPDIDSYGRQISRLEHFPVLTGQRAADASLAIARSRWPDNPNQILESRRWEQLSAARREASRAGDSYFRVQRQLQALQAQLLEQERRRGSLTISWLKTAVHDMQNEMNREVPLEALLSQLALSQQRQEPDPPLLRKQIDERWNTLLSQYHQLMQQTNATH